MTPYFKLRIPKKLEGVKTSYLNPRLAWQSSEAYDNAASYLACLFISNMASMAISADVLAAGLSE